MAALCRAYIGPPYITIASLDASKAFDRVHHVIVAFLGHIVKVLTDLCAKTFSMQIVRQNKASSLQSRVTFSNNADTQFCLFWPSLPLR